MTLDAKELLLQAKAANAEIQLLPGILSPVFGLDFDTAIKDAELKKVVGTLYKDGHFARAVEESFKFLNNLVLNQSGLTSEDGSGLMKTAFSAKNPIIKLNAGITKSEQSEQLGYMEIFAGSMTGIRNPRAHDHAWADTQHRALQLLILADHLVGRVKNAVP